MTTSAFGMIIAVGDYKGDLDAIVDVLNSLEMTADDDDGPWRVFGDGTIGFNGTRNEYPTVYPSSDILVFKDGRRCLLNEADESMYDEWQEEDGTMDCERYSLEQLSNLIAPHLKKGTLELVAVAQEIPVAYKSGICAYYERLIIRSNGSAERHHYRSSSCTRDWMQKSHKSEHFEPSVRKRAA